MNHNTKIMHVHNLQYSIINSTKECTLKDRALSFPTIYCKSHMYKASPSIKFYNIIIIIINYYSGVSISTDDQRNVSATLLVEVGYFFLERRSN